MGLSLLEPVVGIVSKVIDKVFPDPQKKAEALMALEKLRQDGDLQQMTQQAEINKIEAASSSKWASGWRPGVGWVCVAGLGVQVVIGPLIAWGTRLAGHPVDPPSIDTTELMALLVPMLGIGTLRSYDKAKGTSK